MNSVCETAHAKCFLPNPTVPHSGWDKETKQESVSLSYSPLLSSFVLLPLCHAPVFLFVLISSSCNVKTVSILLGPQEQTTTCLFLGS